MNEILIGCDGRPGGEDALALGQVLCEAVGATPMIVTFVPFQQDLLSRKDLDQVLDEAGQPLERAVGLFDSPVPDTRILINRSPAGSMHELAEERDSLAIVVGSSHRGPVGQVLLGTAGASLLAGAPCAVAIAPRDFAGTSDRRFAHIGVAVDGGEQSWPALRAAIGIAERTGGTLHLIGVVEPAGYGYGEAFELISADEYESARRGEIERAIERALAMASVAGVPAERLIETGSPERLIADAAGDLDLLILGSRGYGPVRRVLLGSVSTALARNAPCPVLVVPQGADLGLRAVRSGTAEAAARE
jgi:nucleotide-binding universal stress UspA family protein